MNCIARYIFVGLIFSLNFSFELRAQEINAGWVTEILSSDSSQKKLISANTGGTSNPSEKKYALHGSESLQEKNTTPVDGGGTSDPSEKKHALDGIASYYWQDLYTASGEIFDKRAMTAAHPTLPFGTIVDVTNLGNGRSARVRINDRGPFVSGRVIDVSEAAAEALDMRNRGLAPVRLNIVTASAQAP